MRTILEKIKKIEFTKPEYLFLLIAIPWGVTQIFLMPPFQVPDERNHFYRSWGLANLQTKCDENLRAEIPKNVITLPQKLDIKRIDSGIFSMNEIVSCNKEKIDREKETVFTQFCSYNPIGYIPQAIGINIARILTPSPIGSFYMGRIFNFLASVLLIFYAIKIIPFGKIILLFTALLPMTFHQMASLSGDALNTAGLVFFFSLVIFLSQKEKLTMKNIILVIIASALFTQIKPGYATIILLLLILLPRQFANKKKNYIFFMLAAFATNILLFFALTKLSNPNEYLRPEGVEPIQQVKFIIENPAQYYATITAELTENIRLYIEGAIGWLGQLSIKFSDLFYIFITLSLFTFLLGCREKVNLNFFQRIIIFASSALVAIFIFTLEYVFWTPLKQDSIEGIQGRYITISFLLLLFSIYKIKFGKYSRAISLLIVFVIISALTLKNIHSHYYKKHLVVVPQGTVMFTDQHEMFKEMSGIDKQSDNTYLATSSNSAATISAHNANGMSFHITGTGNTKISYLFEGMDSYEKRYSDIIKSLAQDKNIILNFNLIEKKYDRKLEELKINLTDRKEEFKIMDFKIYK